MITRSAAEYQIGGGDSTTAERLAAFRKDLEEGKPSSPVEALRLEGALTVIKMLEGEV